MKSLVYIFLFFITLTAFSQNNYIVKTEDGRRVLLKADFTWEYIDLEAPKNQISEVKPIKNNENACHVQPNFIEPELDNKVQNQLKKGRATLKHIKQKVAKDFQCPVDQVVLLAVKENKKTGTYKFCANGEKVTYKRIGHSVAKKIEVF
ncbi:hypothetical protein PW52_04810 [Tamlana sedimentorum]|uniref:DUF3157 domain-containing protein n=1 Tax=Neotamlana sedimentorum TaxID=1435349 RepID=A0A0D7WBN6_9FLAO|nr:DUF3157 family protein [Tamlana sedimentorum]KJD36479.1 hypothetical protein PW52_04810 [Tamlana sedimentorum]